MAQADAIDTTLGSQPEGGSDMEQENSATHKIWMGLLSFGKAVVSGMEYVGEGVADILGLDDSKFQDIVDSMTEEEWEVAREVDQKRRLEDSIMEAQEARDQMESGSATEGYDNTTSGDSGAVESNDAIKDRITKEFAMAEMVSATAPPVSASITQDERASPSPAAPSATTTPLSDRVVTPENVVVTVCEDAV